MLIYYGLAIINPSAFLFVSCVMCAVIAICTGSSWSSVGTIGLALMAMGTTLGIPDGMTARSIISGVLGAATMTYAPFAIFCLASPFISAVLGFADKTMTRLDADNQSAQEIYSAAVVEEGT